MAEDFNGFLYFQFIELVSFQVYINLTSDGRTIKTNIYSYKIACAENSVLARFHGVFDAVRALLVLGDWPRLTDFQGIGRPGGPYGFSGAEKTAGL